MYTTAIYHGALVSFQQLGIFLTSGPVAMITSKDHSKRPSVLDDPAYGQHGFVTLKVSQNFIIMIISVNPV